MNVCTPEDDLVFLTLEGNTAYKKVKTVVSIARLLLIEWKMASTSNDPTTQDGLYKNHLDLNMLATPSDAGNQILGLLSSKRWCQGRASQRDIKCRARMGPRHFYWHSRQ